MRAVAPCLAGNHIDEEMLGEIEMQKKIALSMTTIGLWFAISTQKEE